VTKTADGACIHTVPVVLHRKCTAGPGCPAQRGGDAKHIEPSATAAGVAPLPRGDPGNGGNHYGWTRISVASGDWSACPDGNEFIRIAENHDAPCAIVGPTL
jgi:hypothetical protein